MTWSISCTIGCSCWAVAFLMTIGASAPLVYKIRGHDTVCFFGLLCKWYYVPGFSDFNVPEFYPYFLVLCPQNLWIDAFCTKNCRNKQTCQAAAKNK